MIMSLRRKRLLSFVTDADSLRSVSVAFARGVSQVMFQRSALAGCLVFPESSGGLMSVVRLKWLGAPLSGLACPWQPVS